MEQIGLTISELQTVSLLLIFFIAVTLPMIINFIECRMNIAKRKKVEKQFEISEYAKMKTANETNFWNLQQLLKEKYDSSPSHYIVVNNSLSKTTSIVASEFYKGMSYDEAETIAIKDSIRLGFIYTPQSRYKILKHGYIQQTNCKLHWTVESGFRSM